VDRVSQILDLLPLLIPSGAAVTAAGMIILERVRGGNRVDEIRAEEARDVAKIQAESEAKRAEIEATNRAEIATLQVQLALERERNRVLTSSQLGIGSPPG
jgi:hypothetical protein